MSNRGISSRLASMTLEAHANPPLFRLRVFDEHWLEPLRSAATEGSSLDYLLAVEAEQWIGIGVAVGYFAAIEGRPASGLEAPSAESAAIAEWICALEPPSDLDAATFSQALEVAREDLTSDRRSFLQLAVFASGDEWKEAIKDLSSFRASLQREGPASLTALADVSWALEGDLSEGADPRDLSQARLPAGWRYGSMFALRACSARAARRIDAVISERVAIMDALEGVFDSNSIDVEAIVACREAAARQDWARFDEMFRSRLMRGYHAYLSETLGAWEETLDLASLADDPSFPAEVTPPPGYYPITIARCLKHLGRSEESRSRYLKSLRAIAHSRDPDTALYVNNFLTLLIWRGELAGADQLAELNIRALSWIKEPWQHRWQVEHGCSSIAYLRLLQGRLDAASVLFDYATHAWDGYAGDRPWIYDYYPYYRSELILLSDPTAHGDALAAIESLLEIAAEKRWPESICRGHIQAAVVHADRASRHKDPEGLLLARESLNHARQLTTGIHLPDVAIAYHLAELKADLTRREVNALADPTTTDLEGTINDLEGLVQTSGLALAMSEVIAARGAQAYLEGSLEQARQSYDQALSVAQRQGYALALSSPRSLVNWLGAHVGAPVQSSPVESTINLVELIGSDLNDDWMIARLDTLATT
jgi:tetratricopeptide (TPR) repeat protein